MTCKEFVFFVTHVSFKDFTVCVLQFVFSCFISSSFIGSGCGVTKYNTM